MSRRSAVATAPPAAPPQRDTTTFVRNITQGVLEALAGVRHVEQLAHWFAEEPYRTLVARTTLSQRARLSRGLTAKHPPQAVSTIRTYAPHDEAVEATVVVDVGTRTRAVALRLEAADDSWRVASFAIL